MAQPGSVDERIELRRTDSARREAYESEGVRVLEALGDSVRGIEHIGATSVDELLARPIVDIMVGVDSLKASARHVVPLQELGYDYRGEAGRERRRLFRKRKPAAFDLEVLLYEGQMWRGRLVLREFLRKNTEAVERLNERKRKLVRRLGADEPEAYASEMGELLEEYTETALEWSEGNETAGSNR